MKIINELIVDNILDSIKLYQDIFDFKIIDSVGNPIIWVKLQKDDIQLMLEDYNTVTKEYSNYPKKENPYNIIQFKYQDEERVKEIYNKVKDSNIKIFKDINHTEYGTVEFTILDCDNNILIISN